MKRDLIDLSKLSTKDMDMLFDQADKIVENPQKYQNACSGKLMASLFFEPSTRTRLSFEAAMHRLGGDVIGFSDSASSSSTKGESMADTIKTVENYVDLIVMRSPKEGSAKHAAQKTYLPVVNAGDGAHEHPTQTLADLYTIRNARGSIDDITIGFCGDLKFGRTVHSLISALSKYQNIKVYLISPRELRLPAYIKNQVLDLNNMEYSEVEDLDEVIGKLDILYMTRVQKERFFNEADYLRLKDSYILDKNKLKNAKKDLAILHPLPRVNEIPPEIDTDPRAWYFRQVKYAMYVRMSLILNLLEVEDVNN